MPLSHSLRRRALELFRDTFLESIARHSYQIIFDRKALEYDYLTKKVIRKTCGEYSNCIDVGAYRGELLKVLLDLCPHGTVYGFEPVPRNVRYLRSHFSRAIIFDIALGNTSGTADFFYVKGRPARSGLKKQSYPDPLENIQRIEVKVATLDETIPEDISIDMIKIDVEGAELQVMQGASRIIKECKPLIVFEHAPIVVNNWESDTRQLYRYLTQTCNMKIRTLRQWLDNKQALTESNFITEIASNNQHYFTANQIAQHP
jgi:FkbM family methyltransferase